MICVCDGEPVLYGIVSWGYGCADPGSPGVYAKVATVIDWMHDIIGTVPSADPTTASAPTTVPSPSPSPSSTPPPFVTQTWVAEGPQRLPTSDVCPNPMSFTANADLLRRWRGNKGSKILGGAAAEANAWKFMAKVLIRKSFFIIC